MTRTESPGAHATGLAGPDDSRLVQATEEYAELLRAGERPDRAAFLARHADIADALGKCLDGLEFVHAAGNDLSRPGTEGAADGADLLLSGVPLGDYQLIRELGRGGMGIVYEAEQLSLGRRVALKVLPFAATMDGKQLQRFKNEARAAAGLHHEHIVPVYGVGCDRGVHYYAMQLIDGVSLAEMIRRASGREPDEDRNATVSEADHFGLTPRRSPDTVPVAALTTEPGGRKGREFYRTAAQLIADAADALEHAHSVGIVHRDVKPGNLLVDESGKLWVTDFGLARFGPDAGLTMSGDLIGTLRYMAPEQVLSHHGLVDHRVDVYALGATLYELLTGRPAVDGNERAEVLRRIAFEDSVAPRKLNKAIPTELETIALKCLAKNPVERYVVAGDLAADLRRWLDDKPIKAKPPTAWQRAARRLRRHPVALAAGFLVATLVAAAAMASVVLVYREKVRTQEAYAHARKALDGMSDNVIEGWLRQEGSVSADQRKYLRQAAEYYEQFADCASDDEPTRAGVAAAYRRIGDIYQKLGPGSHEALAALDRARELYTQLLAANPENRDYQRALPTVTCQVGQIHATRAQGHRRAVPLFREALAIFEQFDATGRAADERAQAYSRLAHSLDWLGESAAAVEAASHALAIREQRAAAAPANRAPRYRANQELLTFAAILADAGRMAEAERACREAVARLEKVVAEFPNATDSERTLCGARKQLGRLLADQRRPVEAEPVLRAAAEMYSWLVDLPASAVTRARLENECAIAAWARFDFARLLSDGGRFAEAELLMRQAIALKEKHVNREFGSDGQLADFYLKLGRLLAVHLGRIDDALEVYRRAAGLNPKDFALPYNFGLLWNEVGRYGDAEAAFRRAININPNGPGVYLNLGRALRHQDRYSDAVPQFRRGHEEGMKQRNWPGHSTLRELRESERLATFAPRLPSLLAGETAPADATETMALADYCRRKEHYVAAARHYVGAFAADRSLAGRHIWYVAACSAALASDGRGRDATKLGPGDRARFRQMAHEWLAAELATLAPLADGSADRSEIQSDLRHWQTNPDFSSLRGPEPLAAVPDPERAAWTKLWADVAALRNRTKEPQRSGGSP